MGTMTTSINRSKTYTLIIHKERWSFVIGSGASYGSDNNFSCKIIWGDETSFTNKGIFNRRNKHFYATNNPHLIQEVRPQVRFSLNLWCGLIDNKLLGPYFIQGNLQCPKIC